MKRARERSISCASTLAAAAIRGRQVLDLGQCLAIEPVRTALGTERSGAFRPAGRSSG